MSGPHDFIPPDVTACFDDVPTDPEPLPPKPPHPGLGWALLWCLGIKIVILVVPSIAFVAFYFLSLAASGKDINPEHFQDKQQLQNSPEYAQAMLLAVGLSQLLSISTAWLVIRLIVGRNWPRILALRLPSLAQLLLVLLGLPGLMIISMGVLSLARQFLPHLFDLGEITALFGKWPWPIGVLVVGVGPGIGEELWCRGFLGRGLVARHGVLGGVLLTSLLFGLLHIDPCQAAAIFVIGLFLHGSYLATRSLLVPMLLHTANNSLAILAIHFRPLNFFHLPDEQFLPWQLYAAAALLMAAVAWALFASRTRLLERPDQPGSVWRPDFPGVELPPRGSATRLYAPLASVSCWLLVAAGVALFATVAAHVEITMNG